MTADDIVMLGVRPPRHVKIDVDGYEFDVVSGMGRMLNGRNLRTIHIELDEHAGGREAARVLEGAGFTVAHVQSWPQYPGISNMLFRRAS